MKMRLYIRVNHISHDFSQIPIYPNSPVSIQIKQAVNSPEDVYKHEADRIADQVMNHARGRFPKKKTTGIQRNTWQPSGQIKGLMGRRIKRRLCRILSRQLGKRKLQGQAAPLKSWTRIMRSSSFLVVDEERY